MCKDGESAGEKIDKRKTMPHLFTSVTARQAQEASVKARNLRKKVRADMLNKVVQSYDFGEEMIKALKKCDNEKLDLITKALRIIGLTHDQSEEVVNKLQIDAKTDNKVDTTVKFVLGERPTKQ